MIRKTRSFAWEPLLFFSGALAFRGIFLAETRGDPLFSLLAIDARAYFDLAMRFASGDWLYGRDALWFPPLYPTLVGAVFRVAGPEPLWIRAIQLILGAATAALGFLVGRRVSLTAGRVAGAFLALSPVLVFYENQVLLTGPAVFATALFLFLFLRARAGAGTAAGAGLALGLLGLLRTNALILVPVAAWWLARSRGGRGALAFFAGALVTLVPVLLRNGLVAGAWTPFTVNGGMIFATGFAEDSLGGRALLRSPQDFGPRGAYHREAEAIAGRALTLAEASRLHRERTWERIRENPGWALRLTARKLALLVNSAELDDNLSFTWGREHSAVLAWLPRSWGLLVLAAAAGAVLGWRRAPPAGEVTRVLVVLGVTYASALLVFFVNSRYRLPLVVPGAVLAGVAVEDAIRLVRGRSGARRRRAGSEAPPGPGRRAGLASLLAVLALAPFVFRDPGVREDRALGLVAIGAALEREGRHEEALRVMDRALAIDPSLPGAHQNRALSLLNLGREAEALAAAEEATRLDPGLAGAWMTQGAILAQQDRVEEALPRFERAARLDPGNADALANWAQALAMTGRLPEAVEVGRGAVARGADWIAPSLAAWEARRRAEAGDAPPGGGRPDSNQ